MQIIQSYLIVLAAFCIAGIATAFLHSRKIQMKTVGIFVVPAFCVYVLLNALATESGNYLGEVTAYQLLTYVPFVTIFLSGLLWFNFCFRVRKDDKLTTPLRYFLPALSFSIFFMCIQLPLFFFALT